MLPCTHSVSTNKMTWPPQMVERKMRGYEKVCSEPDLSEQDGEGKDTVGNDASTDDQGTVLDGPVLQ